MFFTQRSASLSGHLLLQFKSENFTILIAIYEQMTNSEKNNGSKQNHFMLKKFHDHKDSNELHSIVMKHSNFNKNGNNCGYNKEGNFSKIFGNGRVDCRQILERFLNQYQGFKGQKILDWIDMIIIYYLRNYQDILA